MSHLTKDDITVLIDAREHLRDYNMNRGYKVPNTKVAMVIHELDILIDKHVDHISVNI